MNTQSSGVQKKTDVLSQSSAAFKQLHASSYPEMTRKLSTVRFTFKDGQKVDIAARPYMYFVLGRQADNDRQVDVDFSAVGGLEGGVSRTHAIVQVVDYQVFVRDFNSRNGTLLNGQRLYVMQNYPLQDGDELTLGSTIATVQLLYKSL